MVIKYLKKNIVRIRTICDRIRTFTFQILGSDFKSTVIKYFYYSTELQPYN
jgi:hypothetical protein